MNINKPAKEPVKASPFVKWVGGKRQLLSQIKARMPGSYRNYYEPFVGGGAVLFELLPTNAVINDSNRALIHTYRQIRDIPEEFLKVLGKLDTKLQEDGKACYYFLRDQYNHKLMKAEYDLELAALLSFSTNIVLTACTG